MQANPKQSTRTEERKVFLVLYISSIIGSHLYLCLNHQKMTVFPLKQVVDGHSTYKPRAHPNTVFF